MAREKRGQTAQSSEFASLLREGAEVYEAGEQYEDISFEKVPDGSGYVGRLSLVEFRVSKQKNLYLHRDHIVLEGPYAGKTVTDRMMWGNSDYGTGLIRKYIKEAAQEDSLPKDPAELEPLVKKINDSMQYDCKFDISTKDGYTNVYITEFYDVDDKVDIEKLTGDVGSADQSKPKDDDAGEDPKVQYKKALEAFVSKKTKDPDTHKMTSLKDEMVAMKKKFGDVDAMISIVTTYDWPRTDLSDEEFEMFEGLGITDCVTVEEGDPEPEPEPEKPATRTSRKVR